MTFLHRIFPLGVMTFAFLLVVTALFFHDAALGIGVTAMMLLQAYGGKVLGIFYWGVLAFGHVGGFGKLA